MKLKSARLILSLGLLLSVLYLGLPSVSAKHDCKCYIPQLAFYGVWVEQGCGGSCHQG